MVGKLSLFVPLLLFVSTAEAYVPRLDPRATREMPPMTDQAVTIVHRRPTTPPQFGVTDLVTPPADADRGPTEDAPFTPQIAAFVAANHADPLAIFAAVRNTILFEPYYGSRKGANLTLAQSSGSALDIANLLAASLRMAGFPVRYVRGRVVANSTQLHDWIGSPSLATARNAFTAGGIPSQIDGQTLVFEHAWIAVYLPAPGGSRWVQLDPSFKAIVIHDPTVHALAGGPSPDQLMANIEATGALDIANRRTLLEPRVPSQDHPNEPDYDISLIDDYVKKRIAASPQVPPATTVRDLTGYTEIVSATPAVTSDILPLPLAQGATISASSLVPDSLRAHLKIEVLVFSRTQLAYETSLPDLAGKRITIMYVPAAAADRALVAQYGTIFAVPGHFQMLPVLYVGGVERARGMPADTGDAQTRRVTYTLPTQQPMVSENQMQVGDTLGLAIDFGRTSPAEFQAAKASLDAARALLPRGPDGKPLPTAPEILAEEVNGGALYVAAESYFLQTDAYRDLLANQLHVRWLRGGEIGFVTQTMKFDSGLGGPKPPHGVTLGFDMALNPMYAFSRTDDANAIRAFNDAEGTVASALEHAVWEQLGMRGVSTVRLLNLAMRRGIPISHGITKDNWIAISSRMHLNIGVLIAVSDAVGAGYTVTLPERELTIGDWSGVGYKVTDPATNQSIFWISGRLGTNEIATLGGIGTDLLKLLGLGLAIWNLGHDYAGIIGGFGIIAAAMTPLGVAAGVAVVVIAAAGAAEELSDINNFVNGNTSPGKFAADEITSAYTDLYLGTIFNGSVAGALTEPETTAFRDSITGFISDVANLLDALPTQPRPPTNATATTIRPPLTEFDVLYLAAHSTDAQLWQDLNSLRQTYGWQPVQDLVRNYDYIDDHSIESVTHTLATAPPAPSRDAVVLDAASGPRYTPAYAFVFAEWLHGANQYDAKFNVTYTPVTGFDVSGNPIFGQPVADTLEVPVIVLLNQWFITWHSPVGPRDLRAWNTLMKARAAINAHLRDTIDFWAAGGLDPAFVNWASANAPAVHVSANHADSLR